MEYISTVGSIQYDPVDVCGRNPDIVLNSRVANYSKNMLSELLYVDRLLIDYFDKNLCIFSINDLPALYEHRAKEGYGIRVSEEVRQVEPIIRELIKEKGSISASEIDINKTIEWHWGVNTSLQRAALESMYYRGELIIHHKIGTNKSYAFTSEYIPKEILEAKLPFTNHEERVAWLVNRRIKSVGILWNKASDAWLGTKIKAKERKTAFEYLLEKEMIYEINIDGLTSNMYISKEDLPFLERVITEKEFVFRTELIAPLDSIIWDRKLLKELFGFEYKWEIYTPVEQRRYGAYVLPILHGETFIGRIEAVCNRKNHQLQIKNIWYEDGIRVTEKMKRLVEESIYRFASFNDCDTVVFL